MRTHPITLAVVLAFLGLSIAQADVGTVTQIDTGVFRGAFPKTIEDSNALHHLAIKTILSLHVMPLDIHRGKKFADKAVFNYKDIPLWPFMKVPTKTQLEEVLQAMINPALQPVYVHCLYGMDRTGLVAALYRIHVQGCSAADAYREMIQLGFSTRRVPELVPVFEQYKSVGSLNLGSFNRKTCPLLSHNSEGISPRSVTEDGSDTMSNP